MRRNLKLVLVLLISMFQVCQYSSAFSANQQNSKVDAVLVIDVSGSMKKSDPGKLGFEGVKMFIDMCSDKGDNIGVVAYSNTVESSKYMTLIKSKADKENIKKFVSSLNRESQYTDITTGLNEAVDMLDKMHTSGKSTNKPMIVVFTDGNNDIPASGNRKYNDIQKDLNSDINKSKQNKYPIYTIGLNADNKLNKKYLKNISDATNSKSFITTSASQLPSILSQIFADNLKLKVIPLGNVSANGKMQCVDVNIPNSNVIEANISIMSSKPVELGLSDPNKVIHKIPSQDVICTKSNTYSLLKILKPEMGKWKLNFKGINGDKIDINLIYNYCLTLDMEPLHGQSYKQGDIINIKAVLKNSGQKVTDSNLYSNMNSRIIVKDLKSNVKQYIPMKNTGKSFEGDFKITDSHKYQLKVSADNKSFSRETQPILIDASKCVPTSHKSAKKDDNTTNIILPIVGALVLLAIILLIINILKKNNRSLFGQMIIEIKDENTGKLESPEYKKLNVYKGKVTMHQLLQLNPEYKETEKIVFFPSKNDKLVLKNTSECEIQKSGRTIKTGSIYELSKGDKLKIVLKDVPKTITIEFIY